MLLPMYGNSLIYFGVYMCIVPPNIVVPVEGQEFTITEGSNGSISCTATGYPPPTVVWQNSDGSSLSNMRLVSGSEVMSSTGVGNVTSVSVELMVTGTMRVDTGMYTCSASNIVSNDSDVTVTLTIPCKLISTQYCTSTQCISYALYNNSYLSRL